MIAPSEENVNPRPERGATFLARCIGASASDLAAAPACCKNQADRVETPLSAPTAAVSIGLDVLSEFSEPQNSAYEDWSNAATLDNVSESISCGVQAWLLAGSAAISFGSSTILTTRLRL
jgi:hypothetical protein